MALNYTVKERIAYFSFCRPDKHNALRDEDLEDLVAALVDFDQNGDVDVGILFGEGRSFSSGADVKARLQQSVDDGAATARVDEGAAVLNAVNRKPLIAAVHGYCLGHAMSTALLCDVLVASRDARFQVTETSMGIPMPGLLARLGGGAFAMDVGLTGRFFTAAELDGAGFVARLVDEGSHLSAAEELAGQILANPQGAVRSLVGYRRARFAQSSAEAAELGDTFDWANDPDSSARIGAHLAAVTGKSNS